MNGNISEPLIQVQKLTKAFGDHVVLNGISTEIHQGEVSFNNTIISFPNAGSTFLNACGRIISRIV